jgi:hypothetical protein
LYVFKVPIKCSVCGGENTPNPAWPGRMYHLDTCYKCYLWYVKTSSEISVSKFPDGDGEYIPCYSTQYSRTKTQHTPYKCTLLKGHTGCHIAFSSTGEVYDAWYLQKGFLGLSNDKRLKADKPFSPDYYSP